MLSACMYHISPSASSEQGDSTHLLQHWCINHLFTSAFHLKPNSTLLIGMGNVYLVEDLGRTENF